MAKAGSHSSARSVTRRSFISVGAGSVAAWTLAGFRPLTARESNHDFSCIFINLVGGPSHLDTWDPKPDAPSEYRGPFQAIRTNVPGIWISELFPHMAKLAHHYALVRSLYHEEAPIHETGQQLIQTGRMIQSGDCHSHISEALAHRKVPAGLQQAANTALIPGQILNTGVDISHGQDRLVAFDREQSYRELTKEPPLLREQYGLNHFGQSCLLARRMVEQGVSSVTINMFDTVYDTLSWDCHADGSALNVNLNDYRDALGPMFDLSFSALLVDLESRGLLQKTLVVATGEFGRSPKINLRGGRDHWTGAWTALFAGGGVQGGQIVGCTDRLGREPRDRPVQASAIANTVLYAAGRPWAAYYPNGEPIRELFAGGRGQ